MLPRPGVHSQLLGTSVAKLLDAQSRLLDRLVDARLTPLRLALPSGHTINAVCSNGGVPIPPDQGATAVLCHGLGAALGFFFNNVDSLLRQNGGNFDRVVAVDWLGFGASSRPNCAAPRHPWWGDFSLCKSKFDVAEDQDVSSAATNFFIDNFDDFRAEAGIDTFTLIGHSLGGYLSARYVRDVGFFCGNWTVQYGAELCLLALIVRAPHSSSSFGVPSLPAFFYHVHSFYWADSRSG